MWQNMFSEKDHFYFAEHLKYASVADPEFYWGRGANSPNPIILLFCRKLHGNEFRHPRAGKVRVLGAPLDPLISSVFSQNIFFISWQEYQSFTIARFIQVMIQPHNRQMSFSVYISALAVADTTVLLNGKSSESLPLVIFQNILCYSCSIFDDQTLFSDYQVRFPVKPLLRPIHTTRKQKNSFMFDLVIWSLLLALWYFFALHSLLFGVNGPLHNYGSPLMIVNGF